MTADQIPETQPPRSRRALLAAGVVAAAAAVVPGMARPNAVLADDGQNVVLGQTNTATQTTKVDVGTSQAAAIVGSGANTGVQGIGDTAVWGQSDGTNGVWGESTADSGYTGGASGRSLSPDGVGVWGEGAGGGAGVMGISGTDPFSGAPAKTGVLGYAAQDAAAVGVRGETTLGTGVSAVATTGMALKVAGRAQFTRSGKATVPADRKWVDVTVPGGLTSNSLVHATMQTYRAGVAIAAARPNYPSPGKARIYLTKVASTSAGTRIAWLVTES